MFGKLQEESGLAWYEFRFHSEDRFRASFLIVFAFVATHNHFVLDRGGKVFNRSAPVIKLPQGATEADHLALLGLLNSSTACFWMKQVFHNKGSTVDQHGARQRTTPFEDFWEHDGTKLKQFPLPAGQPVMLATRLDTLAKQLAETLPDTVVQEELPTAMLLEERHRQFCAIRARMIALQEDMDWVCYGLYGLLPPEDDAVCGANSPFLDLGQRAFEIVLARQIADGEEPTTWFARHGATPITEIPPEWPDEYQKVVQRRIEIIENDLNIGLIERPEYKRRWNTEPWEQQQEKALRNWLLDRLEGYFDLDGRMNGQKSITAIGTLQAPKLTSIAKVADLARQDKDFIQVAELYTGRPDYEAANLVGELIAAESVPCLPVLRYKPGGLDKHAAWERTWELQRREDTVDAIFEVAFLKSIPSDDTEETLSQLVAALPIKERIKPQILAEALKAAVAVAKSAQKDPKELMMVMDAVRRAKKLAIGDIPVPPKYKSADFINSNFWRLRGKLDVPKERWVSFPYCEGDDGTLVIAWAGYDHLQLARAIAERYEEAKEYEGRKLVPLLACIGQLIPWLKQWHNEMDPLYGSRMGDFFEDYLVEEVKALDMTVAEVMAWKPPEQPRRRGRRRRNA